MDRVLQRRITRVEALVEQLKTAGDPETRAAALELVQTLMEIHYAGLDRMMEIVSDSNATTLDVFAQDDSVANMLLLHGLHPIDLESRVMSALDTVRPYLHSHGGNVELIEVAEGIVRLRMIGTCDGCPSSALTIKTAIEKAILEAAPDVVSIETA
jgi:Fe-S cluster biogenesis protein NfuA